MVHQKISHLIVASATKKRIRKEEEETKAECHVSFQKVTAALSCRVIKIMVPHSLQDPQKPKKEHSSLEPTTNSQKSRYLKS